MEAGSLMECVCLRVKDVDFGYARVIVRDGKGSKDPVTMLPLTLAAPLERHLTKVKAQHEQDLEDGFGEVQMPDALERKYRGRCTLVDVAICISVVANFARPTHPYTTSSSHR